MVERRKHSVDKNVRMKAYATCFISKMVQLLDLPSCQNSDDGRKAIRGAIA